MVKLTQWYLTEYEPETSYLAHGFVYNHYRLSDGSHIHTSSIERIVFDSVNNRLLMDTYSGSHYELLLADIDFTNFDKTRAYLQKFNISTLSEDKCRKLQEKAEVALLSKVQGILNPNELYLGGISRRAFFKNAKGTLREIPIIDHLGMFRDSVLVTDREKNEVSFCYFPKINGIQPYFWSDGLDAVVIDNDSSNDIEFQGFNGMFICKAGMVTRIKRGDA